jgi:serralysin
MSYTAHTPGDDGLASFYPTTPMYYDLLAVQAMYGRNLNHNAGNTTYKFVQGGTYWQTIDDTGGHDNIQYIGSQSVAIDLREGHFSKVSNPITFTNKTSITATVAIGPNTVIEDAYGGSGNDALTGNDVGNKLFGNDGNDTLVGGNGNDMLYGGNGNDKFYGGAGNDVIYGGAGNDSFYFTNALSDTSNVDSLRDFAHGSDFLYLSHSIFTHISTGHLSAASFITSTHALNTAEHIIYDKAHGALYFDADGSGAGAQVEFATVTAGTMLTASDIIVY